MTVAATPLLTGLPAALPAGLGAGHGWERCLVRFLPCATGDDRKPVRLLPRRRFAPTIFPVVGRAAWATSGGDDLGGGVIGEGFGKAHGQTVSWKNKSAMPKIILDIRRHCRHLTCMKATKYGINKQGNRIAIATKNGLFSVLIEKENQQHGKISKSWFHIKDGLNSDEAEAIFKRRTA